MSEQDSSPKASRTTGRPRTSTPCSGSPRTPTRHEIKKAYRKLARANHPDSNPDDTKKHDLFKEIAEAYDVIGDADKRKKYDEFRRLQSSERVGGFGGGRSRGGGGRCGFDINDFLREQGGGGGGFRRHVRRPLRRRGAAHAPRRRDPAKGADVEASTTLGFEDALNGTTISLRLTSDAPCADVQGHRRQARHPPAHLSRVRGRRVRRRQQGRRVLDERDLPGVRRAPARVRRGVPHLPRLRSRPVDPDGPGAHPGRGQGRPEDQAARQGQQGRERRPGRGPDRHHPGRLAPGVRPQR